MASGAGLADKVTTQAKDEMLEAVEADDPDKVSLLLKAGLDINADICDGDSALHIASAMGAVKACSCLLMHKADVNLQDKKNGYTALHYAAGEGQRSVVQLLISHGADIAKADYHGQVAAAWARTEGLRQLVDVKKDPSEQWVLRSTEAQKFGEQEAARRRIERRIVQMIDTEDEVLQAFGLLKTALLSLTDEEQRSYSELEKVLALAIEDILQVLENVHKGIRDRVAASLHDSISLFQRPHLFNNGTVGQLIQWHSYYEEAATNLLAPLRAKLAEGVSESKAMHQMRLCEQLLPKPTQQISRYLLFMEEMLADTQLLSQPPIVESVKEMLQTVKAMIHELRERKRDRESKEKVREIAKKMREVPKGTRIAVSGRRLQMQLSCLWQIMDPRTKRKVEVILFNDAMMLCLPTTNSDGAGSVDGGKLHFGDLVSLKGFSVASCPTVEMVAPDRYLGNNSHSDDFAHTGSRTQGSKSPGARSPSDEDQSYCLNVNGRLLLGANHPLSQLADAINAAVMELRRPPSTVGYPEGLGSVGIGQDSEGNTQVMYFF